MIEQLNTIDYDDEEFEVKFYDTRNVWTVSVHNMRNNGRKYWWRCAFTYEEPCGTDDDVQVVQQVVQHFFAAYYPTLKAQIIDFIARYFF